MATAAPFEVPDTLLDSARIEACLDQLDATLGALARLPSLDDAQRMALGSSVHVLLANRTELVDEFAHAFTMRELHRYRATHRHQATIDDHLIDEALHYYALLRLAEGCEPGSAGHLQRTAAYCRVFAGELGCDSMFIGDLFYAAKLHDIGLIIVPPEVVEQRGLVDSYERMLLDTHTKAGAYLVNGIIDRLGIEDGPLVAAHEIVLYHHERYDGQGVLGLAGEAIPFAARVFQFADTYDALRRPRPHRAALDHADTVAAIRDGNQPGVEQFDPALLEPFLACADEFAAQFEQLSAKFPD